MTTSNPRNPFPDDVDLVIDAIHDAEHLTDAEKARATETVFKMYDLWVRPRAVSVMYDGSRQRTEITFHEKGAGRGQIITHEGCTRIASPELWQAIGDWLFSGGELQPVWDAHLKWMDARHREKMEAKRG